MAALQISSITSSNYRFYITCIQFKVVTLPGLFRNTDMEILSLNLEILLKKHCDTLHSLHKTSTLTK